MIWVSFGKRRTLTLAAIGEIAYCPMTTLAVPFAPASVQLKNVFFLNATFSGARRQLEAWSTFAVRKMIMRKCYANGVLVACLAESVVTVAADDSLTFFLSDAVSGQLIADTTGACVRNLVVTVQLLADRVVQRAVAVFGAF